MTMMIIMMSIRRDAAIGVAQAERDAGVREAECVMISEQVLILMVVMMIVMMMVAIENDDDDGDDDDCDDDGGN